MNPKFGGRFLGTSAVIGLSLWLGLGAAIRQPQEADQTAVALVQAIEDNDTNSVARMLAANTNLTRSTYYGRLPLHVAASKGRAEIVTLLLQHGADINAP